MKRIILMILTCSLLVGCGMVQRSCAVMKGSEETCIDGVKYLQFPSGATVKYQTDGKIATCNK